MAKIDTSDLTQQEKQASQKATRILRRNLKSILATATTKQTGLMLSSAGAGFKMKFDQLHSLYIKASDVTFKQHYGFEGIKKNGVQMNMKPFDHFGKLLSGNVIDNLATEIGNIRAEQVTRNIRF